MRLALALTALALLTGCGGGDADPESPPTSGGELVEYSRTGGFAPVLEHLTVERGGEAVLETGFEGSSSEVVEFTLDPIELDELTAAVEAAPLEEFEAGAGPCSDCYEYSIEAGGESIEITDGDLLEGSEASVPNEIFTLLEELRTVVENHRGAD